MDARDPIERLFARRILQRFPKYGEFWNRFVGFSSRTKYPSPYGLKIPQAIPRSERSQIRRSYEEMCMAHYSLFCHLAGGHFGTYKLKASFPTSSKSNWFKHWETFESVYLHLGICFNEVYHLWDLLFLLRGEMKRIPNGEIRQMRGGPTRSSLMDTEFKNARKLGALVAFKSLKNEISARRNNMTHYARGSTLVIENRPYVPMRVQSNIPWRRELRTKKWWETSLKAAQDLKRTEDVIDATHSVLIAGLDLHFSNKGIAIQR
jgi:hypothetical protein